MCKQEHPPRIRELSIAFVLSSLLVLLNQALFHLSHLDEMKNDAGNMKF